MSTTPSIDRLRREARKLRRDALAGETAALARISAVTPGLAEPKHADALHVIARENGFASWPRLKLAAEIAGADRATRADRLKRALYLGQHHVTDALLAADPDLAHENFGLEAALYDLPAVQVRLARDPGAATRAIGPRRPILHLAFSRHIHAAPDRRDAMLAIAEALLAHGADVNDGYPAEAGSPHQLSALYGALGHADNLALAEWLLAHGANPNDDESLYHSTELPHRDGLRLLLAHGARPEGTNALARALDFDDLEAVRLLLDAGADPNEGARPHPSGEPSYAIPALHQAARRMRGAEAARLLIAHGADGTHRYRGHTAYALARIYGNRAVARALEEAGQATPLDETEAILAAAARGDTPGRVDPARLDDETRRILTRILAFPDPLAHAQRLVAVGIDPAWTEEMGMPAIHVAGWEGHADAVAWLLTFAPDLAARNGYGGDLLGTIVHGSENCPARARRNHFECARLVLDAGSPIHRSELRLAADEAIAALLADWADRHPERVVEN